MESLYTLWQWPGGPKVECADDMAGFKAKGEVLALLNQGMPEQHENHESFSGVILETVTEIYVPPPDAPYMLHKFIDAKLELTIGWDQRGILRCLTRFDIDAEQEGECFPMESETRYYPNRQIGCEKSGNGEQYWDQQGNKIECESQEDFDKNEELISEIEALLFRICDPNDFD